MKGDYSEIKKVLAPAEYWSMWWVNCQQNSPFKYAPKSATVSAALSFSACHGHQTGIKRLCH